MKKYILILFIPVIFHSCEDSGSSDESFEYEDIMTSTMIPGPIKMLDLRNTNGAIHITGSDTAAYVSLEIIRRVKSYRGSLRAQDHINDIQVVMNYTSHGLEVISDHPVSEDLEYEVHFTITAPIIFDYSLLLGNGDISLNSVSRNLDMTLGNGTLLADVILLNDCNVMLEGGNGTIHLIVPDITNASVNATVGNGSISETGLQMTDKVVTGNTLSGIMGEGEGVIQVILGNGSIILEGY